jgi:hypothetical protein
MNPSPEQPQTTPDFFLPGKMKIENPETSRIVIETPEKPERSEKVEIPDCGRRKAAFGFRLTGIRISTENVSACGTDRQEGRQEYSRRTPETLPHDGKGQ